MRLVAQVHIEHSNLQGSALQAQRVKEVQLELLREAGGSLTLSLGLKPQPLLLPVVPPVVLYGSRVPQGHLGVRFLKVRTLRWGSSQKTVQVGITCDDIEGLSRLRDALDRALQGSKPPHRAAGSDQRRSGGCGAKGRAGRLTNRRPLAPRPVNLPESSSHGSLGSLGGSLGGSGCTSFGSGMRSFGGGSAASSLGSGTRSLGPAPSASLLTSCQLAAGGRPAESGATATSAAGGDEAESGLESLTPEQAAVVDAVLAGKSVFFTGCAGTGKSMVLRALLRRLPAGSTYVTGTTGLAGCALGGVTINSFAGVGRGEGDPAALAARVARGTAAARWRQAQVLIVDEVSMLSAEMFDLLEYVARSVRRSSAPFGGLQLVLSGDFHQLPPVGAPGRPPPRFCFEGAAWGRCVQESFVLGTVFRQTDTGYVSLLAQLRAGSCPPDLLAALLASCRRPLPEDDGILPTRLFTHRADCDAINATELGQLPGDEVRYEALDSGAGGALEGACRARPVLELKVGAQVMLIKNLSHRRSLVNGARGVVEGFTPGPRPRPIVRFAGGGTATLGRERFGVSLGGRRVAERVQLPLDLAWAISVHKSQGMTLDRVEVCLERAFEPGMAYVALSRVRSPGGLRVLGGIAPAALTAHPRVLTFYEALTGGGQQQQQA